MTDIISLLGWTEDVLVGLAGKYIVYELFSVDESVLTEHRLVACGRASLLTAIGLSIIVILSVLGVWLLAVSGIV